MPPRQMRKVGTEEPPVEKARNLLLPIVIFLRKSGMSEQQLLAECHSAIRRASAPKLKLKVVRAEFSREVSDLVNRWLRDPAYLNQLGRPAELPLKGAQSITSLVSSSGTTLSIRAAIGLLTKYRNVKKVASGNFRLVKRFMDFGHAKHVPFEPSIKFLLDATRVSTSTMIDSKRATGLFWRCADSPKIHAKHAKEFSQFAKQRSLSFMHEINDWLDQHEYPDANNGKPKIRYRRLGIGLFGINSDAP